MPQIHESHPRHAHKFGGVSIDVPYPYAEGHQLTAAEAKQVNVWLATTVGNGFNRKLTAARDKANEGKKEKDHITTADLGIDYQAAFDEDFGNYTLGVSNRGSGGSTSTDPVMKQAQSLAKIKVTELIQRKGLKVRDFQVAKGESGDSKFTELVASYIEANPWIVDQARAQLAALAEHDAEVDLDIGEAAPIAQAAE